MKNTVVVSVSERFWAIHANIRVIWFEELSVVRRPNPSRYMSRIFL